MAAENWQRFEDEDQNSGKSENWQRFEDDELQNSAHPAISAQTNNPSMISNALNNFKQNFNNNIMLGGIQIPAPPSAVATSKVPLAGLLNAGKQTRNYLNEVSPFFPKSTTDISGALGIPNTPGYNTATNVASGLIGSALGTPEISALKELPLVGSALNFGLTKTVPQAVAGSVLDPNNRTQGAELGALGTAAGAAGNTLLGAANKGIHSLSQFYNPTDFTAQGISNLAKQGQNIQKEALKGYGGLNSVKDTAAIDVPSGPMQGQKYYKILSNPIAQETLKTNPALLEKDFPGITQEFNNMNSGKSAHVKSLFPQDWLSDFEDTNVGFAKSSSVRKAFENFSSNPTLGNADNLKKAFNAFNPSNSSQVELLRDGKDFLRNNIISPKLQSIDPNLAKNYMDADSKFAVQKQINEHTNNMNNLIRGTIIDRNPKNVLKILKPVIENRQLLPEEAKNTPFGKLYSSHMDNVKNLYDAIQEKISKGENMTPIGKGLNYTSQAALATLLGAPGLGLRAISPANRAYMQSMAATRSQ